MMIRNLTTIAAALLAVTTTASAQTSPKVAYDEACLSCHKQPQRLAARLGNTPEARGKLDAFLAGHYAPDAQKRAALIEYLYQAK